MVYVIPRLNYFFQLVFVIFDLDTLEQWVASRWGVRQSVVASIDYTLGSQRLNIKILKLAKLIFRVNVRYSPIPSKQLHTDLSRCRQVSSYEAQVSSNSQVFDVKSRVITGKSQASRKSAKHRLESNSSLESLTRVSNSAILYQLISNLAWVITLGRSPALQKLVRIRWAIETPRGGNIFFNRAAAHTHEPIFAHNSSTDAVCCKEYSIWMRDV